MELPPTPAHLLPSLSPPPTVTETDYHMHYSFGYGRGEHTNRSAGISIFIGKKLLRRAHVKLIFPVPFNLSGRVAAMRITGTSLDWVLICIYLPPRNTSQQSQAQYKATIHAIIAWRRSLLNHLPL